MVARWFEHWTGGLEVPGSSPTGQQGFVSPSRCTQPHPKNRSPLEETLSYWLKRIWFKQVLAFSRSLLAMVVINPSGVTNATKI